VTPAEQDARASFRGLVAALSAFVIWGLLPLYLRPLAHVDALQIMANRLVWCCLCVLAWLALRGELAMVRAAIAEPATRIRLCASAVFISINWLVYVWGVTHGHVVETSLGYFINPLVNVLLGVAVLRERLDRVQWCAVALAASGVAYLTWVSGRPPWIALLLAFSFGMYGLLRKLAAVEALAGLAAETALIAPIGVAYLAFLELSGTGALGREPPAISALLLGGGPLTAIPLTLFAFGARRLRYATVGILQYAAPSLQLLLGVFVYREPFPAQRMIGFGLIWLALILYGANGLWRARRSMY
jgi:chloramphenicol-sensitive protein RarD